MSMPNIPDITPDIDISFEEAVNLLLTSIAMEEVSLSKLIESESDKVKHVLDKHFCGEYSAQDILSINDSVNSLFTNMIKMQMLLQSKLESVEKLIPKEHPCPPHPKPCPRPPKPCCHFSGSGGGAIICGCEEYKRGKAKFYASVFEGEKESLLTYNVTKNMKELCMVANNCGLHIYCLDEPFSKSVIICGKGKCTKRDECDEETFKNVDFRLTIWNDDCCKKGFEMLITSEGKCGLYHDSGFVADNKIT